MRERRMKISPERRSEIARLGALACNAAKNKPEITRPGFRCDCGHHDLPLFQALDKLILRGPADDEEPLRANAANPEPEAIPEESANNKEERRTTPSHHFNYDVELQQMRSWQAQAMKEYRGPVEDWYHKQGAMMGALDALAEECFILAEQQKENPTT